ncbi:zinc-binding dehydrogenase [Labrys sp. (in: a-proteobacteria)]|uniref:zinc-binding dehydrogenase n=1 Tax=Labrys sp. (in: a-proteobacteria) TaxID=1917972 RepID=UPI0039E71AA2
MSTSQFPGCWSWQQRGDLKVIVDRTFPLGAAPEAHTYAEGNSILGRVVIVPARQ